MNALSQEQHDMIIHLLNADSFHFFALAATNFETGLTQMINEHVTLLEESRHGDTHTNNDTHVNTHEDISPHANDGHSQLYHVNNGHTNNYHVNGHSNDAGHNDHSDDFPHSDNHSDSKPHSDNHKNHKNHANSHSNTTPHSNNHTNKSGIHAQDHTNRPVHTNTSHTNHSNYLYGHNNYHTNKTVHTNKVDPNYYYHNNKGHSNKYHSNSHTNTTPHSNSGHSNKYHSNAGHTNDYHANTHEDTPSHNDHGDTFPHADDHADTKPHQDDHGDHVNHANNAVNEGQHVNTHVNTMSHAPLVRVHNDDEFLDFTFSLTGAKDPSGVYKQYSELYDDPGPLNKFEGLLVVVQMRDPDIGFGQRGNVSVSGTPGTYNITWQNGSQVIQSNNEWVLGYAFVPKEALVIGGKREGATITITVQDYKTADCDIGTEAGPPTVMTTMSDLGDRVIMIDVEFGQPGVDKRLIK